MGDTTDYFEIFHKEFCPPLDEPLLLAIASEYDLRVPEQRQSLIDVLSSLKKSALEEENVQFDPTGTGGFKGATGENISAPSRSTPDDGSKSNDIASITTGLSELQSDGSASIGMELESLSQGDKLRWLGETFPNIVFFEISNILKKCNGNLNSAIDNLLSLSFLPKGIDGFSQDENFTLGRKGRGKRKSRTTDSSRASSVASQYTNTPPETTRNIWTSVTADVEFICARTTLEAKTVRSAWHSNNTSLSATIRALALKQVATISPLAAAEPTIQIRVADLKQDFQKVPDAQLHAILDLARNIPSAAHELVEAMVSAVHVDTSPSGKLEDLTPYAPVRLENEVERASTPSKWAAVSPAAYVNPSVYVTSHSVAAGTAFQQANSAHKRGNSDRPMGGAAAHYSSLGHEHMRLAKQQSAANADARVAGQSSSTHVDLHGVSVPDAVRIARDQTEQWWEDLGDTKYYSGGNNAARSGFRIVTGIGKHSKDGALRIGPAVSKMLIREGWRAEVLAAEIVVRGKAKH